MSFDWTEYLHLAKELANQKTDKPSSPEAKYRSSISRAYYAAHGKAKNYLASVRNITIPESPEAHQLVIEKFKELGINDNNQQCIDISSSLKTLRTQRNIADYKELLRKLNISSKAILAISTAEQVITDLSKL